MNIAKPIITSFLQETLMQVLTKTVSENSCGINCLKSLIKVPACFKNHDKPTCIDVILTNSPNLYQHSNAFETGLSDSHFLQ